MAIQRVLVANFFGQGWVALMGFAFIPLYIKYLGIEAYGLIGIFAVVQAWLTLLDMGMTPTLNREMALFHGGAYDAQGIGNLLRSLEMMALCLATAIGLSLWLASGWLARDWIQSTHLGADVVADALSLLAVVVALRFIEGLYHGALYGLHQQVWYSTTSAALATLRGGGAVLLLAFYSPTVQAFFTWQVFFSLLSVFIYAVRVHRLLPRPPEAARFSPAALRRVWGFASGMTAIAFLSVLLTQIDKILLSKILTLENFAYYTLAGTLASLLLMLVVPINNAVYPRMVCFVLAKNTPALADLYHSSAQLVTVLTAPAMLVLFFFSKSVVYLWTGSVSLSEGVAPLLSVLALGTFLNALMHIPYQLQLANNVTRLSIVINVVAVVVLIPSIFIFVPVSGAIAAAWLWVALNFAYVAVGIQFTHKSLLPQEKWRWYIHDVIGPTVAAFVCVFIARFLEPEVTSARWQIFVFLFCTGLIALMGAFLVSPQLIKRLRPAVMTNV